MISTCPSRLAKCPFVKQNWRFIETKSPFPRTIHFNQFLIFNFFFVWNILITYFGYIFYYMRYNDIYAKHVNISCKNKKLNWDVIF